MAGRELDGLRATAGELTARVRALQQNLGALQQQLRAVTATASSPDGFVTVTVGARGQLVDLRLDPRIYRRPDAVQLAASIRDTVQRAVEQAQQQVAAISREHAPGFDADSYLRGDFAQRVERFGFIEDQIAGGGTDV